MFERPISKSSVINEEEEKFRYSALETYAGMTCSDGNDGEETCVTLELVSCKDLKYQNLRFIVNEVVDCNSYSMIQVNNISKRFCNDMIRMFEKLRDKCFEDKTD